MSSFSFAEWYKMNGERLNALRRAKYQNDPNYRQRVLETNQASREKRKSEEKNERKEEKKAIRVRSEERRYKVVEADVGGATEKLFTIGALAKALGCSIQAIRLWERQGVIPKTPLRTGKGQTGDRLYTAELVEQIRQILLAQGRLRERDVKEKAKPRPLIRFVRLADGKVRKVPLYLIGVLAKQVNRNVVTLEQMEARGLLPRTPFLASSVNRRLYTSGMIAAVQKAFESRGGDIRGPEAWQGFHNEILAQWTALGVMSAVLVQSAPTEDADEQGDPAGNQSH